VSRGDYKVLLCFSIGLALFTCLVPNTYYTSVLVFVGIHSLLAMGLTLLLGYAGQLSLCQAAFFGMGAYTSGILTTKFGINPWPAIGAGIVLTGSVAVILGMPALKLRGHYLAMATLGFGEIINIIFKAWVNMTGGPSGLTGIPRLTFAGITLDTEMKYYFFIWGIVLGVMLILFHLIRSRVGRALQALNRSELGAEVMGIPVSQYKIKTFLLSSILSSLAGSLYAHFITVISPESYSITFSIMILLMVIVGGMTSLWGSILGAFVMTLLPEYLRVFEDWDIIIYGLILLLILMFMPKGLAYGLLWLFKRPAKLIKSKLESAGGKKR
jgi:branched-chain amino acid transport system permease protein